VVTLAGALMLGIGLGRAWPSLWAWGALLIGCLAVTGFWLCRSRHRPARCWGLVGVFAFGATWCILQTQHVEPDHITRYLPIEQSTLATVEGRISSSVYLASADRGPFGRFSYKSPTTLAKLTLDRLCLDERPTPVSGAILLKIQGSDARLTKGQHVRATGWLSRVRAAGNPGEVDYRRQLADRGMHGRMTLPGPANRTIVEDQATPWAWAAHWQGLRHWLQQRVRSSLALGLSDRSRVLALLETVLLGVKTDANRDLRQQFKSVGLAHLLAISGAHLGILLAILWGLARLVGLGPRSVTLVLLITVACYLLIVPARVPILRASIMAGFLIGGRGLGRQGDALTMLALAAMVVLCWRPSDLFDPGFQLSFTAVAGLILFVQPVSHWLWGPPVWDPDHVTLGQHLWRRAVDYLAVCLVALMVVSPIVAYHFQTVHPLAVVLSILALPAFAAVLAVGYLKIVAGLFWPSVSLVLSGPAGWAGQSLAALVEQASTWPGADWQLLHQPTWPWSLALLAFVAALLAGWFAHRRLALLMAVALLAGWTWLAQHPAHRPAGWDAQDKPLVTLRMLAVSDGTCYLLTSKGQTLLFDCGSRTYLNVGRQTILPVLRATDAGPVDAMVLSHPDLDHFSGALTVARRWPVHRVLTTPQLLRDAGRDPTGTTGFLVNQLNAIGLKPQAIEQGWTMQLGAAKLKALWPPSRYQPKRTNDGSLVLSIRVAGRRILLNGDIQQTAIKRMLSRAMPLRADVTDLPHHGSFVKASPRWLRAVDPEVALQSSGRARAGEDPWASLLQAHDVKRWITHQRGMVTVKIYANGRMQLQAFRRR
jgi:competence protein ComEC